MVEESKWEPDAAWQDTSEPPSSVDEPELRRPIMPASPPRRPESVEVRRRPPPSLARMASARAVATRSSAAASAPPASTASVSFEKVSRSRDETTRRTEFFSLAASGLNSRCTRIILSVVLSFRHKLCSGVLPLCNALGLSGRLTTSMSSRSDSDTGGEDERAARSSAFAREMRFGNVDQLLCAQAERFVGNKWSSFTHHVCYLRELRGVPKACAGSDIYGREIDKAMVYI